MRMYYVNELFTRFKHGKLLLTIYMCLSGENIGHGMATTLNIHDNPHLNSTSKLVQVFSVGITRVKCALGYCELDRK